MTPSDKPESAASHPQQDAESTSVITQSKDGDNPGTGQSAETGSVGESPSGSGDSPNPEALDGTDTPPPWQRGTGSSETTEEVATDDLPPGAVAGAFAPDSESTQQLPRPGYEPGRTPTEESAAGEDSKANRTSVSFAGASATRPGAGASARRPSRGPRRASLQIKRLDPWSVLKLALVLSVALFFVWMIAVAVLYGVLDGMGVWDQLNGTFTELTQPDDAASEPLISAGRVFGVASIIGAVNIVLITALSTVAAFIYNVAADFAGGVEVTLSERE